MLLLLQKSMILTGEFVSAMKLIDDEKYDMLTSKKAKFLFCHFKKIEYINLFKE